MRDLRIAASKIGIDPTRLDRRQISRQTKESSNVSKETVTDNASGRRDNFAPTFDFSIGGLEPRSIIRDACDLTQLRSNHMENLNWTLLDKVTLPINDWVSWP